MNGTSPDPAGAAIAALQVLIVHTLQGEDQGRFTAASNLCVLAQNLIRLQAKTVDEIRQNEGQGEQGQGLNLHQFGNVQAYVGGPMGVGVPNAPRLQGARGVAAFYDMPGGELQRTLVPLLGPILAVCEEAQRATAGAAEVQELATLTLLRDKLPEAILPTLNTRVDRLVRQMEIRNVQFQTPAAGVADPVLLRGPEAGGGEREGDEAPRLRADPGGGEGDERPAGAGDERGPLQEGLVQ